MYKFQPILRDTSDDRDYKKRDFGIITKFFLPDAIDLSANMPTLAQGQFGTCQSHGMASLYSYIFPSKLIDPSRMYIYYNARRDAGRLPKDEGATARETIQAVAKYGCSNERIHKYTPENLNKEPSKAAYAIKKQSFEYYKINTSVTGLMKSLSEGYPVLVCFVVYESMSGLWSILPTPSGEIMGGHLVLCVGYDKKTGLLKMKNWWGNVHGGSEYFYVRFEDIIEGRWYDFWTLRKK